MAKQKKNNTKTNTNNKIDRQRQQARIYLNQQQAAPQNGWKNSFLLPAQTRRVYERADGGFRVQQMGAVVLFFFISFFGTTQPQTTCAQHPRNGDSLMKE